MLLLLLCCCCSCCCVTRIHGLRLIGHRGGMLKMVPEHTVLSYTLGIEFGADFVEPDVVSTKDGVLVCRHDVTLGDSTNVGTRPEFASRRRTRELVWPYRHNVTGWFVQVIFKCLTSAR